jgi:hypothetical protein
MMKLNGREVPTMSKGPGTGKRGGSRQGTGTTYRPVVLDLFKNAAQEKVKELGHDLTPWYRVTTYLARALCIDCGLSVQANSKIEQYSGPATERKCNGRKTS